MSGVTDVDPALVSALREQLEARPPDARRVGWNIFHRAVAFGEVQRTLPSPLDGALVVNGVARAGARVAEDFAATVRRVARILAAVGERLRPGDRIITGSVVQVGISPGDAVVAEFGPLGRVGVSIA